MVKYPDVRCAPPGFPFDGEQNEEGRTKDDGDEAHHDGDGDGDEEDVGVGVGRATDDHDDQVDESHDGH